jgi:hypothetical protein
MRELRTAADGARSDPERADGRSCGASDIGGGGALCERAELRWPPVYLWPTPQCRLLPVESRPRWKVSPPGLCLRSRDGELLPARHL